MNSTEKIRKMKLLARVWQGLDPQFQRDNQYLGRKAAVGCVALEITQRCNLDCTLCYLSENSEKVKNDISLDELKRRLDRISQDFGSGTKVQITGGDPTLRKRGELVEIVRYAAGLGLETGLMTNGIFATRELLKGLKTAGLKDLSFHVDLTQKRPGIQSEKELNWIREEYINRARGLGLFVIFSVSVCEDNLLEIPDLVRFFIKHSDVVSMCSFQMQANTGRSVLGRRSESITFKTVSGLINKGADASLTFDSMIIGHPECHQMATALVAGETVIDVLDDSKLVEKFLSDTQGLSMDRNHSYRSAFQFLGFILRHPSWYMPAARFLWRKISRYWRPLLKSSFRLNRLTFFCQNFMDSDNLNVERIRHCAFKVATQDGAVSMCLYNAHRDEYILPKPFTSEKEELLEIGDFYANT